jgi:hypothetical protein
VKRRYARLTRRWLLVFAALPLLQVGACSTELLASATANLAANQVAGAVFTPLETVLFNLFGV